MRIDIWTDITCPYCYLGIKNLRLALQQLPMIYKAEIIVHSFEVRANYTSNSHIIQGPAAIGKNKASIGNIGLPV